MFNLRSKIQQDFPSWEPSMIDYAETFIQGLAGTYNLREEYLWKVFSAVCTTLAYWDRSRY